MDVFEQLLIQLEQTIASAKKSMFSSTDAIVNRSEIMDLIARIKDAYPSAIRQAQYIVDECEKFKQDSRDYAQRTVADADARRNKMLEESEILRIATEEANEIKRIANDIRIHAEYEVKCKADAVLKDSETTLKDALSLIRGYREDLRKPQQDVQSAQPVQQIENTENV